MTRPGYRTTTTFQAMVGAQYPNAAWVCELPIGRQGWSLDDEAAVIRLGDGPPFLVTTRHGALVVEEPGFLTDRLRDYAVWACAAGEALHILAQGLADEVAAHAEDTPS